MSLAAVRVCGDGAERLETRAGLPRVGAVARVERAVVQEPLDLVAQLAQPLRRSGVSLHARESNQRGAKMEGRQAAGAGGRREAPGFCPPPPSAPASFVSAPSAPLR